MVTPALPDYLWCEKIGAPHAWQYDRTRQSYLCAACKMKAAKSQLRGEL